MLNCFAARSVQRLTELLDHYGLDVQDLSPEQRDKLPALLKQLQLESSFSHKATKGLRIPLLTFECKLSYFSEDTRWMGILMRTHICQVFSTHTD